MMRLLRRFEKPKGEAATLRRIFKVDPTPSARLLLLRAPRGGMRIRITKNKEQEKIENIPGDARSGVV